MKHGKKYMSTPQSWSTAASAVNRLRLWTSASRPLPLSSTRLSRSTSVWALTPVTLTSRSAALSFCPTAPARTFACCALLRAMQRSCRGAGADIVGAEDLIAEDPGRASWISTCYRYPRHDGSRRPSG